MLKANFKSVFFITLVTTLTLLVGCSSPEEKKAAQIKDALILSEKGANAEALKILGDLDTLHPNDLEILKSMGQIYSAQGDATMAAFFLEQAYLQAPDDTELLLQTYRSLEAAQQPAGHLLEKLAEQTPAAMTPALWVRLGEIRQSNNRVQPALDAYLAGVDPDQTKPEPETAANIGQLFAQVGNLPQAETWFKMAADNDDPTALTALFSLLQINLRQKNWADAETTLAQLDKQFPGAVEASQWQQARQELIRWREDQDAKKAKLAREAAEQNALATARATAAAEAAAANATTTQDDQTDQTDSHSTNAETGGKAQVIADLEAAEAMADAPAIEVELPEETPAQADNQLPTSNNAIAFNPNISIEPADPEITFDVTYDQASVAEATTYNVETTAPDGPPPASPALTQDAQAPETFSPLETTSQLAPTRPSERPQTIEELMADAETATLDRDYKSAIRKYWAAISIANNRADVWNLLSRAYLIDGQLNNAETSALEAVRLEPRQVAYTLDYLRVAQRSKDSSEFLSDLETAYARFPTSPEIILSLARGHERISKNLTTARNLYLRFINLAPNHPLVPEAKAAVARLD